MNTETAEKFAALEAAVGAAATPDEQVAALCGLAVEQWEQGMDCALRTAEQAQWVAAQQKSPQALARSLCTAGYLNHRLSDGFQARARLEEALALTLEIADTALEAQCRHYLGLVHYGASELEAAMAQYLGAQALYQEAEDHPSLAQILNEIGNVYYAMNDAVHALSCFIACLGQHRASGDRRGEAVSLNNIGNIYADMSEFKQAISAYEQCLAVTRETGAVSQEMACLGNISIPYARLGRVEDAVQACRASLALARRGGSRGGECFALLNWAGACQIGGRHEDSVRLYQEALVIAQEVGAAADECEACTALGECFLSLRRLPEARAALLRARQAAKALQMKPFEIRACRGLSEVCKREGDFAQALEQYQEFHAMQQEAQSAETENRTRALLIQMQVEQVQNDAEAHHRRSVELIAANAALEASNFALEEANAILQDQARQLERQAAEDSLTGLANRRCLEEWLASQFAQARRSGRTLTVAMADVDHFKQINDRFGHQAGDEVLVQVARIFRHVCRASDLAARYGGEEFVLALPDTDVPQARFLCERVRQAVEAHPWGAISAGLTVTISMGLADSRALANHTLANQALANHTLASHERLLGLADAQLYDAKHAGRNRVASASYPCGKYVAKNSSVSAQA